MSDSLNECQTGLKESKFKLKAASFSKNTKCVFFLPIPLKRPKSC